MGESRIKPQLVLDWCLRTPVNLIDTLQVMFSTLSRLASKAGKSKMIMVLSR